MSPPFEILIALRYLRAKRHNSFISFISLISIIGIALGMAALIIVLSVMNGFQKEIRDRLLGAVAHIEVGTQQGRMSQWRDVEKKLYHIDPHLVATAPFISAQGLLSTSGVVRGTLLRGVNPQREQQVDEIAQHMVTGQLSALKPGEFGVVLGIELARQLGVSLGEKVIFITPEGNITPVGMMPRLKQLSVVGLFKMNMYELDASLALIHLHDAQVLFRLGDAVSGLRVKLNDVFAAPAVKARLQDKLGHHYLVTDWTDLNANYFRAVQIEKRMMTLILTLIIAVAAFNLVSTLVMIVTDKQADIAILRTMGATPSNILKIFMLQGAVAGVLGTLIGVTIGIYATCKLDTIVGVIESLTGTKILSSQVYMIDYLPTDIHAADVLVMSAISLVFALLATIYPSIRAARTQPAQALRYE